MEVPQPPKLLDRLRQAIRFRHLSRKTDKSYLYYEDSPPSFSVASESMATQRFG